MIFIIVIIVIIITELLWELLPLSPNRLVCSTLGSLVAHMVKNLPAIQETQVQSLGQEDPRRREWQPTPVLPGEFHGQRSLAGYSPRALKGSDTTEQLSFHFSHFKSFNLGRHIGLSANCHICEKYYGPGIRPYL